nr:uncharacterized protein LOC129019893 [Pongo pygmaeus]
MRPGPLLDTQTWTGTGTRIRTHAAWIGDTRTEEHMDTVRLHPAKPHTTFSGERQLSPGQPVEAPTPRGENRSHGKTAVPRWIYGGQDSSVGSHQPHQCPGAETQVLRG